MFPKAARLSQKFEDIFVEFYVNGVCPYLYAKENCQTGAEQPENVRVLAGESPRADHQDN